MNKNNKYKNEFYYDDLNQEYSSSDYSNNIVDYEMPNDNQGYSNDNYYYNENEYYHGNDNNFNFYDDSGFNQINEGILYKIYNLNYELIYNKNIEATLRNLSFEIYAGDKIAIVSTDHYSSKLLVDLIKNRIANKNGFLYYKNHLSNEWIDLYGLTKKQVAKTPEYQKAILNIKGVDSSSKFHPKKTIVKHIFKYFLNRNPLFNSEIYEHLVILLDLNKLLKLRLIDLTDTQISRVNFICDVISGHDVLIASNLTNDFDVRQKIEFYRFINLLFQGTKTTIIFNVVDTFEIKLLANRILVIDDGKISHDKKLSNILKTYNTVDSFVFDVINNAIKRVSS